MKPRTLKIERTPCPGGSRVTVTAASFDACQCETMRIMDDIENGAASFTYPVKQADGQFISTGHVMVWETFLPATSHPAKAV